MGGWGSHVLEGPWNFPWLKWQFRHELGGHEHTKIFHILCEKTVFWCRAFLGTVVMCSFNSDVCSFHLDSEEVFTLQGTNRSTLGKRKQSSKVPFWGDMLVARRVILFHKIQNNATCTIEWPVVSWKNIMWCLHRPWQNCHQRYKSTGFVQHAPCRCKMSDASFFWGDASYILLTAPEQIPDPS